MSWARTDLGAVLPVCVCVGALGRACGELMCPIPPGQSLSASSF